MRVRMGEGIVYGISKGGIQELHTISETAQRGRSEERKREGVKEEDRKSQALGQQVSV